MVRQLNRWHTSCAHGPEVNDHPPPTSSAGGGGRRTGRAGAGGGVCWRRGGGGWRRGAGATGERACARVGWWGGGARGPPADALSAAPGGNPLFVVETIGAGVGAGSGGERIGPKLQAVIAARIRQLSAPAQRMLGVAATIGRAFTADLIAEADDV